MYSIRTWCTPVEIDLCYFPICIITHNNNEFNKTLMYSRSKFSSQKSPIAKWQKNTMYRFELCWGQSVQQNQVPGTQTNLHLEQMTCTLTLVWGQNANISLAKHAQWWGVIRGNYTCRTRSELHVETYMSSRLSHAVSLPAPLLASEPVAWLESYLKFNCTDVPE